MKRIQRLWWIWKVSLLTNICYHLAILNSPKRRLLPWRKKRRHYRLHSQIIPQTKRMPQNRQRRLSRFQNHTARQETQAKEASSSSRRWGWKERRIFTIRSWSVEPLSRRRTFCTLTPHVCQTCTKDHCKIAGIDPKLDLNQQDTEKLAKVYKAVCDLPCFLWLRIQLNDACWSRRARSTPMCQPNASLATGH